MSNTADAQETTLLPRLSAIGSRYDAVILDLWGVVHDGVAAYPWAGETLARMKQAGLRLAALSNAPRRVGRVVAHMDAMGIPTRLLDLVHSSGEATFRALLEPVRHGLGPHGVRHCFHIGIPEDGELADEAGLRRVAAPEGADVVLCTGTTEPGETLEDHHAILHRCLARGLPMVCANPDLRVMHGPGWKLCAGAIA
ncbi:MAG: TIGR01459 family HAD-type hydrolase, partial [Rhodospirillales bacterium]